MSFDKLPEKKLDHGFRMALALLSALVLAGAFRTLLWVATAGYMPVDLAAYYAGSKLLVKGEARLIYDQGAQAEAVSSFVEKTSPSGGENPPYIYLPAIAAAMVPLGLVSFQQATYLWTVLILAVTAGYGWTLLRLACLPRRALVWLATVVVLLLFNPTQEALLLGQTTPLIALLTALAIHMALDRPARAWVSGLLLGLAAGIKFFPMVMAVPPVLRRQYTMLGGAVVVVLGMVAAGLALPNGMEVTLQYFTQVVPRLPAPWSPLNLSLSSTLGMALAGVSFSLAVFSPDNLVHFSFPRLLPLEGVAAPVALSASTMVFCLGIVGAYRLRHDPPRAWMVWTMTIMLAMPLVWGHYLMLVPISLALLWRVRGPEGARWWVLIILMGFALNRFYRPMLYFGVHPALTNLLAVGPLLALWAKELRPAAVAPGAPRVERAML